MTGYAASPSTSTGGAASASSDRTSSGSTPAPGRPPVTPSDSPRIDLAVSDDGRAGGRWPRPRDRRLRTEAFAALAGVAPLPASSGQQVRHRLNPHGDRQLNWALHMAVLSRMSYHDETRIYVARWTAEGLSRREIRRCLKRHLARRLFKLLEDRHRPRGRLMRLILTADDGTPVTAIDHVERYSTLDLAGQLGLAITAAIEGWDLPNRCPTTPPAPRGSSPRSTPRTPTPSPRTCVR